MITQIVYDSTENQIAVWHRDSVLHPDKNNNLCLYGMRNAADEWVIPPQYESISTIHYGDYNNIDNLNTYYIVNQGDKRGVINSKGEIVIPIEWDGLDDLGDTHAEPKEPLFRDMLNWEQPYSKIRFACAKNELYGVINIFNEIILKPIYQSVSGFKNNLFEIEVKERHGIVDQSGQIIVEPNYYDLEFTNDDDLFITIDTFSDANEKRIIQKKGLIRDVENNNIPNFATNFTNFH
jgi:WG containing repeat